MQSASPVLGVPKLRSLKDTVSFLNTGLVVPGNNLKTLYRIFSSIMALICYLQRPSVAATQSESAASPVAANSSHFGRTNRRRALLPFKRLVVPFCSWQSFATVCSSRCRWPALESIVVISVAAVICGGQIEED